MILFFFIFFKDNHYCIGTRQIFQHERVTIGMQLSNEDKLKADRISVEKVQEKRDFMIKMPGSEV